jgi:tetratricopeptide (TPR) repeat protein
VKRLLFGCWLALIVVSDARACLWDRDTVANESQGVPEAIDVIAGRFERNPPLYFQMRKERVLALLKREPANLAAYDDAAVACDRLGDDDGAIKLMEEKARQLAVTNAADKSEQLYRYEANIGTFYVHRWIRSGASRKNMGDVDLASRHIGEALRINPNAHLAGKSISCC